MYTELRGGKGEPPELGAPGSRGFCMFESKALGTPMFTNTGQCGPGALQLTTTLPSGAGPKISPRCLLSHTGVGSSEWVREHFTRSSRFPGLWDNELDFSSWLAVTFHRLEKDLLRSPPYTYLSIATHTTHNLRQIRSRKLPEAHSHTHTTAEIIHPRHPTHPPVHTPRRTCARAQTFPYS